jgi:hypothetical protein
MDETKSTKVFVSYSHDSPEHKQWVTDFSSNLVKNGIDVILDQWDLGLGDDVPKFMEKSVSSSDRVLMICTELYVRKADDGVGGVGYEAMVVTGELVQNIGTSKFIPVLRQKTPKKILPKSMSTRFYVDMSLDDHKQFEVLLRELHQAPAVEKPALGKNPFVKSPSGKDLQVAKPLPPQVENYSTSTVVSPEGSVDAKNSAIQFFMSILNIGTKSEQDWSGNLGRETDLDMLAEINPVGKNWVQYAVALGCYRISIESVGDDGARIKLLKYIGRMNAASKGRGAYALGRDDAAGFDDGSRYADFLGRKSLYESGVLKLNFIQRREVIGNFVTSEAEGRWTWLSRQ